MSLFRVQVDHTRKWKYICDICWAHVCDGNPHYRYGGIWPPNRGGHGERNHKPRPKTGPPPRDNAPASHATPADHDAPVATLDPPPAEESGPPPAE
ncbi:MAG: hypothetical protein AAGA57_10675 [Planctomycetota bacterium]